MVRLKVLIVPLLLEVAELSLFLGGVILFLIVEGLVAKRELGDGEGDGLLVKKAFFCR